MPSGAPNPPKVRKRDAARTKARIFEAAVEVFAERGFDGARVDQIAERADVNKRMIYIYWGDKQDLYQEILRQKVTAMHDIFATEWGSSTENLIRYFKGTLAETELLRFFQWEALAGIDGPLVAEADRRKSSKLKVAALKADQDSGNLTSAISAPYLLLVFMALASYPVALPQNVQLVTGMSWDDPKFQAKWVETLGAVGKLLSGVDSNSDQV